MRIFKPLRQLRDTSPISAFAEQRRSLNLSHRQFKGQENYLHFSPVWRKPYRGETEGQQSRGEGLKRQSD